MSTVITLIKANEVVNQGIFKGAPLSNRMDAGLVSANIHLAEDQFLKTFINPEFYNDLVAQKTPNEVNYNPDLGAVQIAYPTNADYEILWTQYLFPYLSRAVYFKSLTNITLQTTNQGVMLNNTQYSENSKIKGLSYLNDEEMQNLEGRKPEIIKFLCNNVDKYPLWDSEQYCSHCKIDEELGGKTLGFVF